MAATLWNGLELKGWIGSLLILLHLINSVSGNVTVTIQKVGQTNLYPKVEISNNITSDDPSHTSDYLVSCNSTKNEQQVGPAVFSVGSQEFCPKTEDTGCESYYKIEVTIRFAAYNYSMTFEHTKVNNRAQIKCTSKCAGMSSTNLLPFIGQNTTANISWTVNSIDENWSQQMGCRDASTNQEMVNTTSTTTRSVVSTMITLSTGSKNASSTDNASSSISNTSTNQEMVNTTSTPTRSVLSMTISLSTGSKNASSTNNASSSISNNNQIEIIATSVSASAGLFIMVIVTGVLLYLRFHRKPTKYPASKYHESGDESLSAQEPNADDSEINTKSQHDSSGYETVVEASIYHTLESPDGTLVRGKDDSDSQEKTAMTRFAVFGPPSLANPRQIPDMYTKVNKKPKFSLLMVRAGPTAGLTADPTADLTADPTADLAADPTADLAAIPEVDMVENDIYGT